MPVKPPKAEGGKQIWMTWRAKFPALSVLFNPLLSFSFLAANIHVIPEGVSFPMCAEGWTPHCASWQLWSAFCHSTVISWPFWGSALQPVVNTVLLCLLLQTKKVWPALPFQTFPLPRVLTVTWNLPSLLLRLLQPALEVLPFCTLCFSYLFIN